MTTISTSKCIDISEIANRLSLSQRTLGRLLSAGKLPKPDIAVGRIRRGKEKTINPW